MIGLEELKVEIGHAHDERFSTQRSEEKDRRFCGRCQSWLPNTVGLHHCVKAPRAIGYAWYEHDEPAIEKNSIIQESRPAKRGELIKEFPVESS